MKDSLRPGLTHTLTYLVPESKTAATRYEEFRVRYLAELDAPVRPDALQVLQECRERGALLLLTATKDVQISHAAVLSDKLQQS